MSGINNIDWYNTVHIYPCLKKKYSTILFYIFLSLQLKCIDMKTLRHKFTVTWHSFQRQFRKNSSVLGVSLSVSFNPNLFTVPLHSLLHRFSSRSPPVIALPQGLENMFLHFPAWKYIFNMMNSLFECSWQEIRYYFFLFCCEINFTYE